MRTYAPTPRYKPPLIEEIHSHEAIQKALWDGEGDVKAASVILGCAQSTLYDYMDRTPESKAVKDEAKKHFRRAKVEEREKLLYAWQEQKKNAPVSFSAIKYYLDTHGKEEGWGKVDNLTDEEVVVLRKLLQNEIGPPDRPKE
jgi:hypothetical protein